MCSIARETPANHWRYRVHSLLRNLRKTFRNLIIINVCGFIWSGWWQVRKENGFACLTAHHPGQVTAIEKRRSCYRQCIAACMSAKTRPPWRRTVAGALRGQHAPLQQNRPNVDYERFIVYPRSIMVEQLVNEYKVAINIKQHTQNWQCDTNIHWCTNHSWCAFS